MSTDISAKVFEGFRLTVKDVTKTVTKFDEDTGKPYDKTVPSHIRVMIGNVVIHSCINKGDICDISAHGMDAVELQDNEWFLGEFVADVGYGERFMELKPHKPSTNMKKATKAFGAEPKQYLVREVC